MRFSLRSIDGLRRLIEELSVGLTRLDFLSNFDSFKAEVTIASGSTAKIRNELDDVPNEWIVVRKTGDGNLAEGSTEWTSDHLYITNHGPASVTATILFLISGENA